MKGFYCLLIMLCPYPGVCQQVQVGEKVPDIVFKQVLNSKTGSIELSQLKGKLVILDYWATWCGNCLKKFNLLDSLQRQYAGKLQVILVSTKTSRDTKEKLRAYLNKHVNAAGEKFVMPAAYNDSTSATYFPHSSLPYYVWIGPDGKCLAFTNGEDITYENISLAIAGGKPAINDLNLMHDFVFEKPLFAEGNAGNGEGLLARSSLSSFIPGMAALSRYSRNKDRLTTQYKMINLPLLDLLKKANQSMVRTDRIIFKVTDSVRQKLLPQSAEAKRANSYSYELICAPMPHPAAMALIQADLKRYFGLYVQKENLPAPCYLLTVDTALLLRYKSKGGAAINKLSQPENRYLQNETLEALALWLDGVMGRYVKQQVSIPFTLDLPLPDIVAGDDEALIAALARMGIILTAATANTEQFIIYQTNNNHE